MTKATRHILPYRIAVVGFCIAVIVIGLGAFTRLRNAGLGCPDWPTCYGHVLWPTSDAEVEHANTAFRDFNQNLDTTVDHQKTWPEQVHRIFASSLGIVAIALFVFAIRHRKNAGYPFKLSIFLLFFIGLQGAFGYLTVKWLVWPQVVTTHLLGGFTTLAIFWLIVQRLGKYNWTYNAVKNEHRTALRVLAVLAAIAVALQIFLGGWTAANYAALACPDLPFCHGQLIPPGMDFAQGFNFTQDIGPNYLGGVLDNHARTAIHFAHRAGAMMASLTTVMLVIVLFRSAIPQARRWGVAVFGLLCLQVILGVSNVMFSLPLPIAVAHNVCGALLFLSLITLLHRLFAVQQNSQ